MPRLFEGRYRPRQSLDIKVGKFHMLEALIQVRPADWEYFQQHRDDVQEELLELLQERVLPRMFGKELEAFYRAKHPGVLPPLDHEYYGDEAVPATKRGKKKRGAATAAKSKKGGAKKKKGNNAKAEKKVEALEDEDGRDQDWGDR